MPRGRGHAPGGCADFAAASALFGADAVPALRQRGILRCLADTAAFVVSEVHCADDRRGPSGPGVEAGWSLVMVRKGGFLRRANGHEDFIDASSAYLARPGEEVFTGHPAGAGDVSTTITITAELADRVFAGPGPNARFVTSADFDLGHRRLLAACRRGADPGEIDERVHALLRRLPNADRTDRSTPATAVVHRRLVAEACEALAAGGLTMGLAELSGRLYCSPHHLSRVFHRVTGHTVTYYRNELRVRAVLEDVVQGATNLRTLAARYGFADQAHMSRVVRRHRGQPPLSLARVLTGDEH